MPTVTRPRNEKGEFLVDYEEKVFEDVKAEPGEKARQSRRTTLGCRCRRPRAGRHR